MAFMVIAMGMSFVLRYLLDKYPYPELAVDTRGHSDEDGGKGEVV